MNPPFTRTRLTREATVVGCGVVGLSSAIRLAEAGFKVRIVARDRTPNTTSDVAAAVWYPFRCGPPDRGLGWSRRTFRVLDDLRRDPATGVTMVEGIDLIEEHPGDAPWWKEAVDHFRAAMPEEIVGPHVAGWVFHAPVVAMPEYLGWLEAKAGSLGIAIESRTVSSLDSLLLETSLVANCTGLGARELCGDESLHPVRGQVVRVAPGHARRFVQAGGKKTPLTYVIPRADCTVLGGTQEVESWDLSVDPRTAAAIRGRCVALVPGLANAPVLSHAVGLRPARPEVRLETERRPGGVVIHNYGHGGGGVTLSWGCADEVARRAAAEIPPP
jgi:D-amino-acid oxidase